MGEVSQHDTSISTSHGSTLSDLKTLLSKFLDTPFAAPDDAKVYSASNLFADCVSAVVHQAVPFADISSLQETLSAFFTANFIADETGLSVLLDKDVPHRHSPWSAAAFCHAVQTMIHWRLKKLVVDINLDH